MSSTTLTFLLMWTAFLALSLIAHFLLRKAKNGRFILVCLAYLTFTYYLTDGALRLSYYFSNRGIYLEFGHADIGLIEFLFATLLLAITNIAATSYYRIRKEYK